MAFEILDKIDRHINGKIEIFQETANSSVLRTALQESNERFNTLDDMQAYINKKDQEWILTPEERTTSFMEEMIEGRIISATKRKT